MKSERVILSTYRLIPCSSTNPSVHVLLGQLSTDVTHVARPWLEMDEKGDSHTTYSMDLLLFFGFP